MHIPSQSIPSHDTRHTRYVGGRGNRPHLLVRSGTDTASCLVFGLYSSEETVARTQETISVPGFDEESIPKCLFLLSPGLDRECGVSPIIILRFRAL